MGLEQHLPLWSPLSKNLYALRLLTRQHQRLQELKTQSTNQQHALEHSAFDSSFIDKQLTKLVAVYDAQIDALETAIKELIDEDPILKPRVERLIAIKGLALLSVAVLVAETNGFEGFTNQRHLVSYAGYDVVENQSGNHSGKTRISKKGNSRLRRILHLPAFNAVRFNEPTCKALYDRVYERTHIKMKAYVAVQKRLLLMAYALWRYEVKYEPEYLANRVSKDKKIVPTSGTTARAAPTGSSGRSRVVLLVIQRYEKNPISKFAFHDSTSGLMRPKRRPGNDFLTICDGTGRLALIDWL